MEEPWSPNTHVRRPHPQRSCLTQASNNRKVQAHLQAGNQTAKEQVYVVKGLHRSLLGRPAIEKLQLVTVSQVGGVHGRPQDIFPELFEGLGELEGDYHIKFEDGTTPYALTTPRRVALPLMKAVEKELLRMEEMGVIARVKEATDWCAGMVVVPKSNGKVRIYVDLTNLNRSVCQECHPLPAVDQTLAQLAGAQFFSTLDANSGFWQIPLDPQSALLTTFITPSGRFCFHRLPFGITSAPEHFQRRMSHILSGIPGVVCMMDDIIVHGQNQGEHDERLHRVLQRLPKRGWTYSQLGKIQIFTENRKFLGHVVDKTGIRPDPDKVSAIQKAGTPQNTGNIRRFLGMINQLSKFLPNLAEETHPLRDLLVKGKAWTWDHPQRRAFDRIKRMLTKAPVLAHFNLN